MNSIRIGELLRQHAAGTPLPVMAGGATGATEFIDATTAAVFIPALYSKKAIVAREQKLLMANQVNRVFEAELAFGSVLHVPSVGNLSTTTKNTSSNAATTYQTITETNTDLTVDQWVYQAIALEHFTKVQANRDLLATYAPKQGYALALAIDNALTALATSITNTQGTYATDNTFEDVLRGVQYLDDANAPDENRYLNVSPASKAAFMKLDQFVNDDYKSLNGTVNQAAMSGMLGTWMRIPVFYSTAINGSNAAGHDNMLYQREAIALAIQMTPTVTQLDDPDYLAKKVVLEEVYGKAIMRNDHAVDLLGA